MDDTLNLGIILAFVVIGLIFLSLFFRFIPIGLWVTALASGVRVSFATLFGMRFRKVNPSHIVNPMIQAYKAGLRPLVDDMEAHYLSGGNVKLVIDALISAD